MKKKSKFGKKIVKIIEVNPYSQSLILVCNGSFQDAIDLLKSKKGSLNAIETLAFIEKNKEKYPATEQAKRAGAFLYTKLPHGYVMMLNHQNDWVETVGLVVHESVHLTHYILRSAGLVLCEESEEAYTYLTEKIVEDILQEMY